MALTSGDMDELKPKKRKKYMCKTQVTYEMMPYLMNIPNADDLRVRDIYSDPSRGIVSFVFEGDGYTQGGPGLRLFEIGEGMEIPNQVPTIDEVIEVMREKVRLYDESKAKEKGENN